MNVTGDSVSFRIEVEKDGVWCPVPVHFDIRTPLPAMYEDARQFRRDDPEHHPVRVVVVQVFKVEQVEIIQVFGDVAEPVAN